jgi:hypothetical protein
MSQDVSTTASSVVKLATHPSPLLESDTTPIPNAPTVHVVPAHVSDVVGVPPLDPHLYIPNPLENPLDVSHMTSHDVSPTEVSLVAVVHASLLPALETTPAGNVPIASHAFSTQTSEVVAAPPETPHSNVPLCATYPALSSHFTSQDVSVMAPSVVEVVHPSPLLPSDTTPAPNEPIAAHVFSTQERSVDAVPPPTGHSYVPRPFSYPADSSHITLQRLLPSSTAPSVVEEEHGFDASVAATTPEGNRPIAAHVAGVQDVNVAESVPSRQLTVPVADSYPCDVSHCILHDVSDAKTAFVAQPLVSPAIAPVGSAGIGLQ